MHNIFKSLLTPPAPAPTVQVHAFNTLRCVFNDSTMAMDSSGYHAAGVVAAVNGMSAPAWEVRGRDQVGLSPAKTRQGQQAFIIRTT
jgi:hypothetical protein